MSIVNSEVIQGNPNLAQALRQILNQQDVILLQQQEILNEINQMKITIYNLQHDPLIMYKWQYDPNYNGAVDTTENINGGTF